MLCQNFSQTLYISWYNFMKCSVIKFVFTLSNSQNNFTSKKKVKTLHLCLHKKICANYSRTLPLYSVSLRWIFQIFMHVYRTPPIIFQEYFGYSVNVRGVFGSHFFCLQLAPKNKNKFPKNVFKIMQINNESSNKMFLKIRRFSIIK